MAARRWGDSSVQEYLRCRLCQTRHGDQSPLVFKDGQQLALPLLYRVTEVSGLIWL